MNEDKTLEKLVDMMIKCEAQEAAKQAIVDRISTPFGFYDIQTGPLPKIAHDIMGGTWFTVIGVTTWDFSKHFGPVGVEKYPDKAAAMAGHDAWRRMVMDNPPMILKDVLTDEVTIITAD